ncbi:MAG: zinc-binding dehydrogenase [Acidobacteriota bacterium]|nr:zinc-binding dehydrogenase [Acidobacteriota bacterium]
MAEVAAATTSPAKTMRAVQITAYDGKPESLRVVDLPLPRPGPGEVLVKVATSPINPSDLMFIRGLYGLKKPLPATPGFEGSGTVVESGGGFLPRLLQGKRVACHAADPKTTGGMWAEYLATPASACVPLKGSIALEPAAMMLVNPFTAWALVGEAQRGGHRAIVQTAAASALGRMVVRLAKSRGIPVINVVRRPEQVGLLRSLGAQHVLDSNSSGFDEILRNHCRELGATISFDAVAGEMSGRVLRAQPKGSRMVIYGALSLAAVQVEPGSLVFEEKSVEGFWLSAWLKKRNIITRARIAGQVQKLLASELKSEVRARHPLDQAQRALQEYAADMTSGKVLLVP